MREECTVCVHPGLENGWTGYEQLEGSRYASIKRAEIEVLSCVRGIMCTKIDNQRLLESFDTL